MAELVTIIGSITLALLAGWTMVSIIRDPSAALGLLVFFLPFERIPSFDLGGLTIRTNHLIGGLALAIWLLLFLAGRRKVHPQPLAPLLIIFILALLPGLLVAGDMTRAGLTIILTAIIIALGLLITQLLTRSAQLRPLLLILGLSTIATLIFAGYQFLGDLAGLPNTLTGLAPGFTKAVFGFPRVQAFSQEPLYYGNFLLLPISLAIAFLAVSQTWFKRSQLVIFLLATLVVLALTTSRGALLGLVGSGLALTILLGRRLFTLQRISWIMTGVVLAMLATLIGFSVLGPEARQTFLDRVTVKDIGFGASTVGRLQSWFDALDLWKTSPWVGIGTGNFGPAVTGFPAQPPPGGFPIVNNEYFELLAETGLVGLSLFLLFLFFLFLRSLRAYQASRSDPALHAVVVGTTAAVVGMLVQYNFFSTLYITSLWITLGLLMAVQSIALQGNRLNQES